ASDVDSQAVILESGDGGYSVFASFDVDVSPVGIVAADFNNDGCDDLATANNVGNSMTVAFSACGPNPQSSVTLGCGECGRPQWLTAADFDGDGQQDIAMAFYDALSTGENIVVYLNRGDGIFDATYLTAGQGPSCIVAADFNGDGKPDIAISGFVSSTVEVLL